MGQGKTVPTDNYPAKGKLGRRQKAKAKKQKKTKKKKG